MKIFFQSSKSTPPPPARTKALDFGCGVGRLAIPLAQHFKEVVGVDVSTAMLEEAAINSVKMQVKNVRYCRTLSELSPERGTFSFVNSFIVLQHIAPERGLNLIENMLDLLANGGHGALHMTYGRTKYQATFGTRPLMSRATQILRRPLSAMHRRLTDRDPEMQMNSYPINQVLFQLQLHGVTEFYSQFTDHGGHLGITVCFAKDGGLALHSKQG